jgi:energy-coupling factor transport system ATP-binding protein
VKDPLIEVRDLVHVYLPGTPFEKRALDGLSLDIAAGEAVGLAGASGSGKSTLAQHLNGLLRPTSGLVRVGGMEVPRRGGDLGPVRALVGLLFQFPEQQLFEETVELDVGFGPRNLDLAEGPVRDRVREALDLVGLPVDRFGGRSPFALSGGERRRAALAGVLAMRPRCLVLDEPTAGLDPRGSADLLALLDGLRREQGISLVVISHRMEDLARLVDRMVVLSRGRVVADCPVRELLHRPQWLAEHHLEAPPLSRLTAHLAAGGLVLEPPPLTVEEAEEGLRVALRLNS